jgi:hypothetical protein
VYDVLEEYEYSPRELVRFSELKSKRGDEDEGPGTKLEHG